MLDRRDPERWRDIEDRAQHYHAAFEAGRMRPDIYRAHLFNLGYRGRELESAVSLNWPTMGPPAIPRFG